MPSSATAVRPELGPDPRFFPAAEPAAPEGADPAAPGGAAAAAAEAAPRPRAEPIWESDPLPALPLEEGPVFEGLRRGWQARLFPIDEAETVTADARALVAWRRRRLDAVDERLLRGLAAGRVEPGMPSLATLVRYRARLAKDAELVESELGLLRRLRPPELPYPHMSPARYEWLATMLRAGRLGRRSRTGPAAGAGPRPAPEPARAAEPGGPAAGDVPPPAAPPAGERGAAGPTGGAAVAEAAPGVTRSAVEPGVARGAVEPGTGEPRPAPAAAAEAPSAVGPVGAAPARPPAAAALQRHAAPEPGPAAGAWAAAGAGFRPEGGVAHIPPG